MMTSQTGWPSRGLIRGLFCRDDQRHHGRLSLDQAAPRSAWRGLRPRYRAVGSWPWLGQSAAADRAAIVAAARKQPRVELYVEADHRVAVELYLTYGFVTVNRDVMYAQG